jgi:transcriptional regulator with XRE-family HTH domain
VITNQRQYNVTRAQAKKFADAIKGAEENTPVDIDPRIHQAMIDGLRSQHEELIEDLKAYAALREGKVRRRTITSLAELPRVLIEGRIAHQMTQRRLAEKLGVAEQQIQRYEASGYAGASLERLQEIATAIGLRLRKTIDFELPEPTVGGGARSTGRRSSRVRRDASQVVATVRASAKPAASAKRKPAVSTAKRAAKTKAAAGSAKKTAAKKSSRRSPTTMTKKAISRAKASSGSSKARATRSGLSGSKGSRR